MNSIFILIILLVFLLGLQNKEGFVDPYSLYLHDDIIKRQEIWREAHRKRFYWDNNTIDQHYRE